jgi:hypothetical protein
MIHRLICPKCKAEDKKNVPASIGSLKVTKNTSAANESKTAVGRSKWLKSGDERSKPGGPRTS